MDLSQYLIGAAASRPDSITGLAPEFQSALAAMFAGAPEDVRSGLQIRSGFRSPELQAQLFGDAVKKYGSEDAARKWVAPPGRSQHNHGNAADLKYLSPAAQQWVHANAGNFGLALPLANENWHIELAGARGGAPATMAQAGPPGPPQPPAPPGPPGTENPFASPAPSQLAALFLQGEAERRQRTQEEQAAEQARRAALFSNPFA